LTRHESLVQRKVSKILDLGRKIIISAYIRTQTQSCKSKNKYKKITLLKNRRAMQLKNKRQLMSPL